jgi:hypothetical protein
MTTMGLDVAKVLDNLNNLNIEEHLERVKEKLGDHIGKIDWSAPLLNIHFHLNFQFRELPSMQE